MIINKAIARLYKRIVARFKGIPVLFVIYKPWHKGKNVMFASFLPFEDDPYLAERFEQIAVHIRENWQEKMEELIEQEV